MCTFPIIHCPPKYTLFAPYLSKRTPRIYTSGKKSLPNLRNNTIYRINPVLCSLQQTGMPPLTSAIANSHIVYVFFGNLENIFEKTSVAPTHTSSHTAPRLKLLHFGPSLPLFLHTQTRIAHYNTDHLYAASQSVIHVSLQYTEQDPRKNQSYVNTPYPWSHPCSSADFTRQVSSYLLTLHTYSCIHKRHSHTVGATRIHAQDK